MYKEVMVSEGARNDAHGTKTRKKKVKHPQPSQCLWYKKGRKYKCGKKNCEKCIGTGICSLFLDRGKYELSPNGKVISKGDINPYRDKLKDDIEETLDALMPVIIQIEKRYESVCDGMLGKKEIIKAFRDEFNKKVAL